MKLLTYAEMLALPEAAECPHKESEAALALFLARRLAGKKLSDFKGMSEPFMIKSHLFNLTIDESGGMLEGVGPTGKAFIETMSKLVGLNKSVLDIGNALAARRQQADSTAARVQSEAKGFVKNLSPATFKKGKR